MLPLVPYAPYSVKVVSGWGWFMNWRTASLRVEGGPSLGAELDAPGDVSLVLPLLVVPEGGAADVDATGADEAGGASAAAEGGSACDSDAWRDGRCNSSCDPMCDISVSTIENWPSLEDDREEEVDEDPSKEGTRMDL
jgi:hypothetical protein